MRRRVSPRGHGPGRLGAGRLRCGNNDDGGSRGLIVGTTDKVVSIDPAGSYDNGSLNVQTQVYQYLLNFPAGSTELTPDAAEKCDFEQARRATSAP